MLNRNTLPVNIIHDNKRMVILSGMYYSFHYKFGRKTIMSYSQPVRLRTFRLKYFLNFAKLAIANSRKIEMREYIVNVDFWPAPLFLPIEVLNFDL